MSLLGQFLIVSMCIAGLMLFRMLVDRYILRSRLRDKGTSGDCEKIGCFHSCDSGTTKQNSTERSARHAH